MGNFKQEQIAEYISRLLREVQKLNERVDLVRRRRDQDSYPHYIQPILTTAYNQFQFYVTRVISVVSTPSRGYYGYVRSPLTKDNTEQWPDPIFVHVPLSGALPAEGDITISHFTGASTNEVPVYGNFDHRHKIVRFTLLQSLAIQDPPQQVSARAVSPTGIDSAVILVSEVPPSDPGGGLMRFSAPAGSSGWAIHSGKKSAGTDLYYIIALEEPGFIGFRATSDQSGNRFSATAIGSPWFGTGVSSGFFTSPFTIFNVNTLTRVYSGDVGIAMWNYARGEHILIEHEPIARTCYSIYANPTEYATAAPTWSPFPQLRGLELTSGTSTNTCPACNVPVVKWPNGCLAVAGKVFINVTTIPSGHRLLAATCSPVPTDCCGDMIQYEPFCFKVNSQCVDQILFDPHGTSGNSFPVTHAVSYTTVDTCRVEAKISGNVHLFGFGLKRDSAVTSISIAPPMISCNPPTFCSIGGGSLVNTVSKGGDFLRLSTSDETPDITLKLAIVPVGGEYRALYCEEAPDVRFNDVLLVYTNGRTHVITQIDTLYVGVCDPDTIRVVGYSTDIPALVGASVSGCELELKTWSPIGIPDRIALRLSGIRRGASGIRFEKKTLEQMIANNSFWAQAHCG